jgi:hypothetical protein
VSRLSRQCGILNISHPHRPQRPVTGIALLYCLQYTASCVLEQGWSSQPFSLGTISRETHSRICKEVMVAGEVGGKLCFPEQPCDLLECPARWPLGNRVEGVSSLDKTNWCCTEQRTLCFTWASFILLQSGTTSNRHKYWFLAEVADSDIVISVLNLMTWDIYTYWISDTIELCRPSDRRLLGLVLTFSDRGCCVISATNPHYRILGFLDLSHYYFFQIASQLYSRGWVDPIPDPLLLGKSGSTGNRTRTSGSVARNSDH